MQEYKMIAFDMDGTLLNSRKHISPETRLAIKKAVNAGTLSHSQRIHRQSIAKYVCAFSSSISHRKRQSILQATSKKGNHSGISLLLQFHPSGHAVR